MCLGVNKHHGLKLKVQAHPLRCRCVEGPGWSEATTLPKPEFLEVQVGFCMEVSQPSGSHVPESGVLKCHLKKKKLNSHDIKLIILTAWKCIIQCQIYLQSTFIC